MVDVERSRYNGLGRCAAVYHLLGYVLHSCIRCFCDRAVNCCSAFTPPGHVVAAEGGEAVHGRLAVLRSVTSEIAQ